MRRYLLFALLAMTAHAEEGLQVYMGFMDEEVKFVLSSLIHQHPDRKIIVVERDSANDKMLFELPMVQYGQQPLLRKLSQPRSGNDFENRLAGSLRQELTKASVALQAAQDPSTQSKTKVGSEDFSLYTFNNKATLEKPPIVLVRSPEMGLQPDLTQKYLRSINSALQALPEAKGPNGINYSVFGTSGAIGSHLSPGEINRVNGSVFVGVERLPSGEYQGVIRLADNQGKLPQTFFSSKPMKTRKEAEAAAKEAFNQPNVSELKNAFAGYQTLGSEVRRLQTENGGSVSLTTSFFAGDSEKESGRKLGMTNVNMEDFHVLTGLDGVLRNRSQGTVNVTRFNCDPPQIPPEVVDAMSQWGRKQKYTGAHYADAILWGLEGALASDIPDRGKWGALEGIPNAERYAYRVPGRDGGKGEFLDPFFAEIASDFLSAAQKKKLFSPELFSKVFYDRLSQLEQAELNKLLEAKAERVAKMADAIYTTFGKHFGENGIAPEIRQQLRVQILDLIRETHSLDVPPSPLREKIQTVLDSGSKADYLRTGKIRLLGSENAPAGANTEQVPLEIWVRTGKWKNNTSATLEHLLNEIYKEELSALPGPERAKRFQQLVFGDYFDREGGTAGKMDGSNADRALYKTGLVGGMLFASWDQVRKRAHFYQLLFDEKYYEKELARLREKLSKLPRELVCQ